MNLHLTEALRDMGPLSPDIIFERDGEQMLLYNIRTGDFRRLNETGSFIFQRVLRRFSPPQILEAMREEWECPDEATAQLELTDFLEDLRKDGIIIDGD